LVCRFFVLMEGVCPVRRGVVWVVIALFLAVLVALSIWGQVS